MVAHGRNKVRRSSTRTNSPPRYKLFRVKRRISVCRITGCQPVTGAPKLGVAACESLCSNPRSGWQHKAWGGAQRNPRTMRDKRSSPRSGRQRPCEEQMMPLDDLYLRCLVCVSAVARFTGSKIDALANLGFRCAPPQALCCRPLRGAKATLTRDGLDQSS